MRCATQSSLDLTHVSLAVETARAGGIALLDAVHAADGRAQRCVANARDLIGAAPADAIVGLRLTAAQIEAYRPVLDVFAARPHWIVLAGWRHGGALASIERLRR